MEATCNEDAAQLSVLGALPPNPQALPLFSRQNGHLWLNPGDRLNLSPAFPAAEPVARVASQQSPIPSASGVPRMDEINLAAPMNAFDTHRVACLGIDLLISSMRPRIVRCGK